MTVDLSSLESKLRERADEAGDAAAQEIARMVSANAPRDTGALSQGIDVERVDGMDWVGWTIRATRDSDEGFDVATAQEYGTGIYVPGGSPVVPNPLYDERGRRRKLVFYWKKAGRVVAFYSVRGTPPTFYFSHAIAEWPRRLQEAFGS